MKTKRIIKNILISIFIGIVLGSITELALIFNISWLIKITQSFTFWGIVMLICATATMKILDILFKISYENIWTVGFKVGFLAWIVLLVITLIVKVKSKK